MKTKKVKYIGAVLNRYFVFCAFGYEFRVDKNLKAIPVEVPGEVADLLLQMEKRRCRCHKQEVKYLFQEVN